MPTIETTLTFAVAALLLSLSPGPSNLYIMARSLGQGHQAGVAAAGGMAIGSFIYVMATALGIAAIFKYSPTAYLVLKLAGAGYLLYLGWRCLTSRAGPEMSANGLSAKPLKNVFRQSIVVELTNPKTALFFLAFLPQFVDPAVGAVEGQLIFLGLVYALIAFCSDLFVVSLSAFLSRWFSHHPDFGRWQNRISGTMLTGLGALIVYQELSGTGE